MAVIAIKLGNITREEVDAIAIKTVNTFLPYNPVIERVAFVCFSQDVYDIYNQLTR